MLTKHEKDAYWNVVKDCLTEFLDQPRREALIAVNEYRAQIESSDSPYEMFYHTEPFEIACVLKGIEPPESETLYFANIEKYKDVLRFRNW